VFALRPTAMVILAAGVLSWPAQRVGAQEVPWRFDYAAARQEAREKNLPVLLDFGTANCLWCKKLDATTWRDPAVVRLVREYFIPLRIDGEKQAKLAQMLAIRSYPTLVFAAPDGKILGVQEGYVRAPDLAAKLNQALTLAYPRQTDSTLTATVPAAPAPVVPVTYTGAAADQRGHVAQTLLALAQDDYRRQEYLLCLERCRLVAAAYTDLPEGVEAQKLSASIKEDPAVALWACADLSDRLGELYLSLAVSKLRQGQPQEAVPFLERVLLVSPGSIHAQAAQQRLANLRSPLPASTNVPAP
jgi:thioredoxin-like negative regulator of GroEL